MRILITGGQGQLGHALQQALADHAVAGLSHQELDVTDAEAIRRAFVELRPELAIHAAAWTDTAGCEADPERAFHVNAQGTRHLAQACSRAGAVLLYVSTNEVFDGRNSAPYREEDEPNPLNAYARSKWQGELYVRELLEHFYIVRTAWLYGAGRASFPEKIIRAAREKGTLKVVTDETASPTWTADLARAIAQLIDRPVWGVYHLTNSGHCSRLDWTYKILELAALDHIPVEATTQAELGTPYRKPLFSALANHNAARLGIILLPWQEALSAYFAAQYAAKPNVPP